MTKAIDLLNYNRFDVTAKTLYLRFIDKGINSDYAKQVYKHHLNVWNGITELYPRKNGLEEYISTFHSLKNDLLNNKFNWNKSPILVNNDNVINGSHRLAICLYYDISVEIKEGSATLGETCSYYHLNSFRNNVTTGLNKNISDEMAIEYIRLCKKKENVYIVTLFPSASHGSEQVTQVLKKHCNIIYDKKVLLNKTGGKNLVRQLYLNEEWTGPRHAKFSGAKQKSDACFTKDLPTMFLLVETDNPKNMLIAKDEIRKLFNIGKHSVHINDTWQETFRIANLAFNDNSIHFLNNMSDKTLEFKNFNKYIDQVTEWVKRTNIDTENFAVDSSAVMSAYGLRDCEDLDYLHHGSLVVDKNPWPNISSHNSWSSHYTTNISNLIYNPNNYFWYNDIKFVSLKMVLDMKIKRNENKDIKDVELIKTVLE